jgi:hypothetical protein
LSYKYSDDPVFYHMLSMSAGTNPNSHCYHTIYNMFYCKSSRDCFKEFLTLVYRDSTKQFLLLTLACVIKASVAGMDPSVVA